MATTKKTTAKKAETKKKATKVSKPKEVVEVNPVDEFMKENEGKVLEVPKGKKKASEDKPKKAEGKKRGRPKGSATKTPAVEVKEAVEPAVEKAVEEPVAEPVVAECKTEAECAVEKECVNTIENPVVEEVKENTSNLVASIEQAEAKTEGEVTVELSTETFKELVDKFVNGTPKDVEEIGKQTVKVEKIPCEKSKRSFLNRVFSAMGIIRD